MTRPAFLGRLSPRVLLATLVFGGVAILLAAQWSGVAAQIHRERTQAERSLGREATSLARVLAVQADGLVEFEDWKAGYLRDNALLSLLALVIALVAYRSITKLEQVNAELRAARDEAESAIRMKSLLLAGMSHELRTPLQALLGFAELIERQTKEPTTAQFADQIHASGDRLRRVLGDVIDTAKIEAGTLVVRPREEALRPLLEGVVADCRAAAERKGLALALDVAPDVPERVTTDPALLARIVGNLVDNGVRHTASGAVRVAATRAGQELSVEVADTGPGIPPDVQPFLFQRFGRGTEPRPRQPTDTGLGLALAGQMTELLGGRIGVESSPDTGTRVRVTLPGAAGQG
jgi:signal transduction histidine kinase